MKPKWIIYRAIALIVIGFNLCSNDEPETVTEEVSIPTEGLITTVKEVQRVQFRIEDEQMVAKYLHSSIETFTLEEVQLVKDTTTTEYRRRSALQIASFGLMGSFCPNSSPYVDKNTYNRVPDGAGQRMKSSLRRTTVTRPATGKSGYGSGSTLYHVG
ncbi:MAG: hypothetical protein RIC19_16615 [Phaeodactylibacter sp.]|uniref:hypothetical protein n=1 Tax=Phaeodactylibacter sp. TaxID=1940289 RepID=UPI0032ECEB2B